jgi:uncharacterized protein
MTHTAFAGIQKVAAGNLAEVALAIRERTGEPVLIFVDETGQQIDVDTRGTEAEIAARYGQPEAAPRGPGRPKLGVEAHEVTLLPRHWEWLRAQPGGASVALRKLVEEARRTHAEADRVRQAQEAAYRFTSAMAGNEPGFEEAARALFARDGERFRLLTEAWPADVRDHARKLAAGVWPG